MGALRLFLALCVLNLHYPFSDSPLFVHSFTPVCIFFIISGFYMSLVLDRKYAGHLPQFYLNRLLRLFPIYLAVIILTRAGDSIGVLAFTSLNNPPVDLAADILLIPSALVRLFHPYAQSGRWIGLTAPQMYTVAIEILFYSIAPFLMQFRGYKLAAVLAVAAALHFGPAQLGYAPRAMQYDWPLGVLVFFILGRLSYEIYRHIGHYPATKLFGLFCLAVIFRWCYLYHWQMYDVWTNNRWTWGLYIVVTIGIPGIFAMSKDLRVDRLAGDLSYPIYACQFMVIAFIEARHIHDGLLRHRIALVSVLIFSAVLLAADQPIEALRRRIDGRKHASKIEAIALKAVPRCSARERVHHPRF